VHLTRQSTNRLVLAAAASAAAVVVAGTSRQALGTGAAATPVTVTISHSRVGFSRLTVPIGVIVLRVTNEDRVARQFSVGGQHTPVLAPGKTASLRVVLGKRQAYRYRSGSLSGWLTVIAPCVNPTQSTVTVDFAAPTTTPPGAQTPFASMTFSQTTIPCGNVTFVVKNDTASDFHDLNLDLSLQGGPSRVISGQRVAPGQSTTMTVDFGLKGNVYYYCREPEHSEGGESGYLVID
jgi:hypothetical protein